MPEHAAPPDQRSSTLVLTLLLSLVGWLLIGCTTSPGSPPVPAATVSSRTAAQSTLTAMGTAIRDHDRAGYERQISTRDPAFAATADRVYDNLVALPLSQLTFEVQPADSPLTAPRRALLGPQAFAQQVVVTWRVQGDLGPAEHLLWLTFLPGSAGAQVAGSSDAPKDRTAQPLWLVERVTASRTGRTTVLAAAGQSVPVWIRRGDAASSAVAHRLGAAVADHWVGDLVLELPSTRQAFEQVLGVAPGSYASIAAVAWPEGPDPATSAIRVVVNPALAAELDTQGMAILLTHEVVHVATRSAASRAPTWLVEGMADFVAYDAHPATAPAAAAALRRQVSAHGAPAALPRDDQFAPTAPDLALRYAEAWLACRFLAERYSADRLDRFYAAVSSGTDVDRALRSEFGSSVADFTRSWRSYLLNVASQR